MIAGRGDEPGPQDAVGGRPGWTAAGGGTNLAGQPGRPLLPRYLLDVCAVSVTREKLSPLPARLPLGFV